MNILLLQMFLHLLNIHRTLSIWKMKKMAIIRLNKSLKVRKIKDDSIVDPYIQELQMNLEQIEKGGYEYFMLKEIYEQTKCN